MKTVVAGGEIAEFLHFVSLKKRNYDDWRFVHVSVDDPDQKIKLGEVVQLVEFDFQKSDSWLFTAPEKNELLLVIGKNMSLQLGKFEKALLENFKTDVVRMKGRVFDSEGVNYFSKTIAPHIQKSDRISSVLHARLSRTGNVIMVLDDDQMVLKQMENVLINFGNVVTLQNADEFFERYVHYAPDILFLDIHLKGARGNDILKKLIKEVDPYAHVVMISSDTVEDIVLDIKESGARGFVVKPFNKNNLYQHVMKSPTYVAKKSGF